MPELVNFYENINEARMRLLRTIIMYDGLPYVVLAVCNHHLDGIFRVYLEPLGVPRPRGLMYPCEEMGTDSPSLGAAMDKFLDNKSTPLLRKQMNSPKFNKFRPFPLGMCNYNGRVYYIERQPARHREQGLTQSMVADQLVSLSPKAGNSPYRTQNVSMFSPEGRACILAEHPSASECLKELCDPNVTNDAAAFHRHFALVRGPVNTLFLAYKGDVIGVLPNNSLSSVKLDRKFAHTREVVTELGVFGTVQL